MRVHHACRSRLALTVLLFLGSGLALAGGPESRKAADWTLEERLEMRFNPESMRSRSHHSAEVAGPEMAPPAEGVNVVDGSRNPELLLPHELFQSLLTRAYGPNAETRETYREGLTAVLRSLGFSETFWDELEDQAKELLEVDRESRLRTEGYALLPEERKTEIRRELEELKVTYCQDRARVIAEVTAHYGRERFYDLLYRGVAPHMTLSSNGVTADQARFVAGGCQ